MSLSAATFSGRSPMAAPLRALPPLRARPSRLACRAEKSNKGDSGERLRDALAGPVVAAVAAAMLTGAMVPEEAWAARSGGRMGGSSFRAMPRAGGGGGRYSGYGGYSGGALVAPPLVGGYGYGGVMPFFFPGFGFGFGGGLFQIFIAMFLINAVVNAIRNVTEGDKDDDFDDDF
ncbi:unnamed protein product [Ostreobium quekettii]|uniref:Uncharacterized protein n=1 Tax=Ostreobium quekettii TaxID=121088 RepID=A0A8S1J0J4_9CHLO|nr:unnamed protein product [Ostreobium quekettii]|eukprot:evm.model.scf_802.2 EVM.evm.TU.scf_802.2   scf_802:15134-16583(-)